MVANPLRTTVGALSSTVRVTGPVVAGGDYPDPWLWARPFTRCRHEEHLTEECGMLCVAGCGCSWCPAAYHRHCARCGAVRCHGAWWRWRRPPRPDAWEDQHSFPYLRSVPDPATRRIDVHVP